ncbi:hypothetical protein ACIQM4_00070 [Streptomyces sp. NPDC091272]|uniref:hypothetical protein n=1 Tax=Streptomyces sp. NPDC091272 TaxID=3365981 RepID=UPI00381F5C2D
MTRREFWAGREPRGRPVLLLGALGLVLGGAWWWAVLRLLLVPESAGLVEGTVAAGGWGLSLLPVHVARAPVRTRGAARGARRGPQAEAADVSGPWVAGAAGAGPRLRGLLTTAWRRRRWGGGSGRW